MAMLMPLEGSTTGSNSAGSVHFMNTEVAEVACTPASNGRKRKRRSFSKSPGGPSVEVQEEVKQLLNYVPKIAEGFNVVNKIGEGTFSSVYLAEVKGRGTEVKAKFALKHIIPTSHPERILGELQCLHKIGGSANVMGMNLCLRERDHVVIVMPYFPHDSFHGFVRKMTVDEMRDYVRNLFLALRRVHQFDVIHRDVKPSNFLCNRRLQKYALVDFGLAQRVPVGARPCRAPSELAKQLDFTSPPTRRQQRALPALPKRTSSVKENSRVIIGRTPEPKARLAELDPNTFPRSKLQQKAREGAVSGPLPYQKAPPSAKILGPTTAIAHTQPPVQGVARNNATPKPAGGFRAGSGVVSQAPPKPSGGVRVGMGVVSHAPPKASAGVRHATPKASGGVRAGSSAAAIGNGSSSGPRTCGCFGLPQVCDVCSARSVQAAPRAGTPGFRSPEVLLKCPNQTTAVDMWAAGVILLSILSGRYPFFNAQDDMTALAQIMSVVGTEEMKTAARDYGKEITCSVKLPATDLRKMCVQLRGSLDPGTTGASPGQPPRAKRRRSLDVSPRDRRRGASRSPPSSGGRPSSSERGRVPNSAYDLLRRLLDLNPRTRISAEEALRHPFICKELKEGESLTLPS